MIAARLRLLRRPAVFSYGPHRLLLPGQGRTTTSHEAAQLSHLSFLQAQKDEEVLHAIPPVVSKEDVLSYGSQKSLPETRTIDVPGSSKNALTASSRSSQQRSKRVSKYVKVLKKEREELLRGKWRQRLQTFEQLDFESDLSTPSSTSTSVRLVDYDFLQQNIELWEILFTFRQRVYGVEGAASIWSRLSSLNYTNFPQIHTSETLMKGFIEMASHKKALLYDLCQFLYKTYRLTGIAPPKEFNVYGSVMLNVLRTSLNEIQTYHSLLEHLPPTKEQLCDLIIKSSGIFNSVPDSTMLQTFQELCFELPSCVDMYDLLIPALCNDGSYDSAMAWHKALIKHKDLPTSALSVEALVAHLRIAGQNDAVQNMIRKIGHHLKPTKATPVVLEETEKGGFLDLVSELEKKSPLNSVSSPVITDDFCARLLATRFFGIPTIVNGLSMLNVKEVGPQSVREILLRVIDNEKCDISLAKEYLLLLEKAAISIGNSTFCRLVRKLIADENAEMLYDVAVCDQHPDELDNWKLQEKFLAQFQASGDVRNFDRTLTVLLFEQSDTAYDTKYMNYLTRVALSKGDYNLLMHLLEQMRVRQLPVLHETRTWMFATMMPERLTVPGKRRGVPHHTRTDRFISALKYIMLGGTRVTPYEWEDPIRTLLISGRLAEYEDLLCYILKFHSDESFRNSQMVNLHPLKGTEKVTYKVSHWTNLLKYSRIAEIFAFGWYHTSRRYNTIPVSGITMEERASKIAKHPTFWSLRLLVRLRELGYPIERAVVAEFCKRRLWTFFSLGHRERKRNRFAARCKVGNVNDYILAMEKIWGRDLFLSTLR